MSVNCIVNQTMHLSETTRKVHLNEPLAYSNANAHAMRVTVLQEGSNTEPATLTGIGCVGQFMCFGENKTITPILGTVSGNIAEVILPGACYITPGRFRFTMDLTEPLSTDGLETFSTSKSYSAGDLVKYNNVAYMFTTAHPAGAWNSAHVRAATTSRTALWVEGHVEKNQSGTIIQPGVPIDNVSTVISNANAAATAATTAAAAATDAAAQAANSVSYTAQTGKTDDEKAAARGNIGAAAQDVVDGVMNATTQVEIRQTEDVQAGLKSYWENHNGTVERVDVPEGTTSYRRAQRPVTTTPGSVVLFDFYAQKDIESIIFAAESSGVYTYISGVQVSQNGIYRATHVVPAGAYTILITKRSNLEYPNAYCNEVVQKTDTNLTAVGVAAESKSVGDRIATVQTTLDGQIGGVETTLGGRITTLEGHDTALTTRMTAAEKNVSDLGGVVIGDEIDVNMISDSLGLVPVGTALDIGTKATGYWKYNGDGEAAAIITQDSGSWRYWPALAITDGSNDTIDMRGRRLLVKRLRYGSSDNTRPILFTDANLKVIAKVESKGAAAYDYRVTIPRNAKYMLLTTYTNTEPSGVYLLDGYEPVVDYTNGKLTVNVDGATKQVVTVEKLPYASGRIFFTVDCQRPIPFSDDVVAAGNYTEPITNPIQHTETIECVLRLPTSYTPDGTPTRLVLACHGSTGYIEAETDTWYNSNWNGFMGALVAAGYAVFDANIFAKDPTLHPDWDYQDYEESSQRPANHYTRRIGYALGSPLYAQALKHAYDYIQENYNVYPQIFAHGTSMGGVGAKTFAHLYPHLVLAISSFAGRDMCKYVRLLNLSGNSGTSQAADFAEPYGYASGSALTADCFAHGIGISPSLGLMKIENGAIVFPPDRTADYAGWKTYYAALNNQTASSAETVQYIGRMNTPYKAWNAWDDEAGSTAQEVIMQKAYARGGSAPYEIVNYNTGNAETAHTVMSYGQVNNMRQQLIAWYKRWE